MQTKLFFFLTMLLASHLSDANAQNKKDLKNSSAPIVEEMQLQFEDVSVGALDSMVQITCVLKVQDTTELSKIHLKVGKTINGNELLDKTFLFDDKNVPANMKYKREGKLIYLTIGNYHYSNFYYEAKLENRHGNYSTVKTKHYD